MHHNRNKFVVAQFIAPLTLKKATLVVFSKKPTNTKNPNKPTPQQPGEQLTKNQEKQPTQIPRFVVVQFIAPRTLSWKSTNPENPGSDKKHVASPEKPKIHKNKPLDYCHKPSIVV